MVVKNLESQQIRNIKVASYKISNSDSVGVKKGTEIKIYLAIMI